jgi:adenine-specific DNA-methyltransferase
MARGKKKLSSDVATADFRHPDEKRKNIPPAKIAAEGKVPTVPKAVYAYSPHLPPVLRSDPTAKADALPELIADAGRRPLRPDEQRVLADALRAQEPWLEWAGKREQSKQRVLEVDPVALHIHERVSARAVLRATQREDVQRELFADPELPYEKEVRFYQHDIDWTNRLILGDSVQVMSSLARRENLAGKVQMIYLDPPYGIKFASNFQSEVAKREVRDRDADLTREPEMVRAYRDTWTLGVHSYIAYLRDRLVVAKELLTETGSIFVQISEENVHHARELLDEVFGRANFCSQIAFAKTSGGTARHLSSTFDYLLWYARNIDRVKYHQPYHAKRIGGEGSDQYQLVEESSGARRTLSAAERADPKRLTAECRVFRIDNLTSQSIGREKGEGAACWFPVRIRDREYLPNKQSRWKTGEDGMQRLLKAERLDARGETLCYVRYIDDFPAFPISNQWDDTVISGFSDPKRYVVQTSPKVVQRCILMTTDPGDLVLDPTCGSGTSAYVAEQWGRRWITIDTSRVAIAIARQRLLTARFDHYQTKGAGGSQSTNPSTGFVYKTVPHVALKDIAKNPNLDPIFAKHEPLLDAALRACNKALKSITATTRRSLEGKVAEKEAAEGKRAVTDADRRRWQLPASGGFEHWSVPYDTDADWSKELRDAVVAYRRAWRQKMDEVKACIESNAEQEDLVDEPVVVRSVLRVSGPFTVEGVRPGELSLGAEVSAAPEPENGHDQKNLHAYLTRMVQLLRQDGLTFLNNKHRRFARIEPLFEASTASVVHAEGVFDDGDVGGPNTIAIGFGPQYGPVTAEQVEELVRASKRYDELIIAGFSFDAAASSAIQEVSHPRLQIHQAYIRPDENPAMEGLLTPDNPGNQIFTVFGQPEVRVEKDDEDEWSCTLAGVDIYDPVENTIRSTGADKVAAWFLDSDYDGRCFCTTQAFFPDQDAWDRIAKALGASADSEPFRSFKGTTSLPFKAGKHRRIAVKVIDPRGNEVMAVRSIGK